MTQAAASDGRHALRLEAPRARHTASPAPAPPFGGPPYVATADAASSTPRRTIASTTTRFARVTTDPLSTFSIDVDTASYANVRRFLNGGALPPPDAVRIEELINYFRFDYPRPTSGHAVLGHDRVGAVPVEREASARARSGCRRGRSTTDKVPARNLVFLLDVSGSMEPPDKLPLVKHAMRMLVDTLTRTRSHRDRRLRRRERPRAAVDERRTQGRDPSRRSRSLEAGGSTNGAAGISSPTRSRRSTSSRAASTA